MRRTGGFSEYKKSVYPKRHTDKKAYANNTILSRKPRTAKAGRLQAIARPSVHVSFSNTEGAAVSRCALNRFLRRSPGSIADRHRSRGSKTCLLWHKLNGSVNTKDEP